MSLTQNSLSSSSLALLKKGDKATVVGFATSQDEEQASISSRLLELGFAPGEAISVIAESFPGGDPMAIRLGSTIFGLRRQEAAMINIVRD